MLADLDLNHPSIRIDGKGSKERSVPIPPQAILAMRDYLARRRDLVRGPDQGFLFVGADGKRLLASAYRQWLIRLGNRVLGRHIHPHLLRHACAVHMLLGRADIRIVQEMLGHSDLDTTKVYLRLLPDQLRAEYEKAMPDLMAR